MNIKRINPSGRMSTIALGAARNIGVKRDGSDLAVVFDVDATNSATGISYRVTIAEAQLDLLYMRAKELAKEFTS
jgi:hypothetical protein